MKFDFEKPTFRVLNMEEDINCLDLNKAELKECLESNAKLYDNLIEELLKVKEVPYIYIDILEISINIYIVKDYLNEKEAIKIKNIIENYEEEISELF